MDGENIKSMDDKRGSVRFTALLSHRYKLKTDATLGIELPSPLFDKI